MKIKTIRSDKNSHKWKPFDEVLRPPLETLGIHFVDQMDDADILFCDSRLFETPGEPLPQRPYILIDFYDSPNIQFDGARHALQDSNCVALFSNFIYTQKDAYNTGLSGKHSFHAGELARHYGGHTYSTPIPLSATELSKITPILINIDSSPYRQRIQPYVRLEKHASRNNLSKRTLKLFYSGSEKYTQDEICRHRSDARISAQSVKGETLISSKRIPFETYMRHMQNSLTTISPWGYGAWAHREFEAIASGTIIIKPNNDFLDAPSFNYQRIAYLNAALDFKNINDCMTEIEDSDKLYEMQLLNFDYLRSLPSIENQAFALFESVRKILQ